MKPIRIILVLLGLLLGSCGHLQPAYAGKFDRVLAVGDSIVGGAGTSDPATMSWPAQMGATATGQPGGCVIVSGCGGHPALVETYNDYVWPHSPSVIVIGIGINDITTGASPAQIVDAIAGLAHRNSQWGVKTYVNTLTPLRGWRYEAYNGARVRLNSLIRERFRNVINMNGALVNPETGKMYQRYDSGDGLHPNWAGYKAMADTARAALSAS